MKFFADTADIKEIEELATLGMLDGVTTNPSIIAASGANFIDRIGEICKIVEGSVSAEVVSTDYSSMKREADILRKIASNVTIKVPLTLDGLRVCKELSSQGTQVNVTLCFCASQAILAAKAGATFVSPFVGRLDDIGSNGMELISDIMNIYSQYPSFNTQVLVASIRSPMHIVEAARLGADVITAPPSVIKQLVNHPLTTSGLATFVDAWKKTGQKI